MTITIEPKKILASKKFMVAIAALAGAVLLLVTFHAGMYIGLRKAEFGCGWAQNYQRNFGPREDGFMPHRGPGGPMAHGAFGEIISINLPTFVVRSVNEPEKTVVVTDDTEVLRNADRIDAEGLRIGDHIVVIGGPDERGEIEAKLIRILASMPMMGSATSTP